jgi:hypothetical protein
MGEGLSTPNLTLTLTLNDGMKRTGKKNIGRFFDIERKATITSRHCSPVCLFRSLHITHANPWKDIFAHVLLLSPYFVTFKRQTSFSSST